MLDYIRGMDISSLPEQEKCGAVYKLDGQAADLFSIMKQCGVNSFRFRLWNDPYSEDGTSYGGGTNDLATLRELARRAKKTEIGYLLDFHYSDFWADPGKQTIPKAWRGHSNKELERDVYSYTKEIMSELSKDNLMPQMVQIGNELSNGLLWPNGKTPNYDAIASFVNAGIRAVREIQKDIPIMIHLDNGGNNELYRSWFDHFIEKGEAFDVIGLSYYPFWHGSLEDLSHNMNDIAERYGKELVIAETSTGFTLEDYAEFEKLSSGQRKGMAANEKLSQKVPYTMTPEGQLQFLKDLNNCVRAVPNQLGRGIYYWEGGWCPVPGCEWATPKACEYVGDAGPGGNEWANQALFDYTGQALPAMKQFGLL